MCSLYPSRGSKAWTVKVEQYIGGQWYPHRTVKTKGNAETLTIDAQAGVYRLRLPDQHGYFGGQPSQKLVVKY